MSIMRSVYKQGKCHDRCLSAGLTRYGDETLKAPSREHAAHLRGTTNVYADLGYRALRACS